MRRVTAGFGSSCRRSPLGRDGRSGKTGQLDPALYDGQPWRSSVVVLLQVLANHVEARRVVHAIRLLCDSVCDIEDRFPILVSQSDQCEGFPSYVNDGVVPLNRHDVVFYRVGTA